MTNSIIIDLNDEKSSFLLKGDVDAIKKNRRATFYLKDYLLADLSELDAISIPFSQGEKDFVLHNIQGLLERYGFKEARSQTVALELNEYLQSEENFKLFSKKAKDIWDNDVDSDDFAIFCNELTNSFPTRTLYANQLLAAYHLAFSQNACNFSVPGAGKTAVVYGAYAYLRSLSLDNPKYVNKILIIGPLSSFAPWEDEYEKCFGKRALSKRLSGGVDATARVRHFHSSRPEVTSIELTLLSYQSVPNCLEDLQEYLKKASNHVMVVLDEAHKIKNYQGGVWAESVLELAKHCKSRVVLTGTPAPNGYDDLYNLFKFIWPNRNVLGYEPFHLQDMTANPHDRRIEQLIDNISPFFIRITKQDLHLPAPIEHKPIIVEMGTEQREIYNYIEREYVGYFEREEAMGSLRGSLLKARLIRLMQAASNPELLHKPVQQFYLEQDSSDELFIDDENTLNKILSYQSNEIPSKIIAAFDLTKSILDRGEKVIIWANFISNLYGLQNYFSDNGINSKILYGETPSETDENQDIETRERIIKEFHNPNSSYRVIIANPFAVGESISLHQACHNAIYFERNFNASAYLQSKDRIHRYGLRPDDTIQYYYLLSKDTIDSTIHDRLIEKEQRMLRTIESRSIPLINLNMDYNEDESDDIKAIIRDYAGRHSQT